jgi:hypothetical protein
MDDLTIKQTISRIQAKYPTLQIVVQEMSQDVQGLDSKRIRKKNRPTCYLRFNDSLSKLDPVDLLNLQSFETSFNRQASPTTIDSVAEFARYLSKGGLDNTVVIYFDQD